MAHEWTISMFRGHRNFAVRMTGARRPGFGLGQRGCRVEFAKERRVFRSQSGLLFVKLVAFGEDHGLPLLDLRHTLLHRGKTLADGSHLSLSDFILVRLQL